MPQQVKTAETVRLHLNYAKIWKQQLDEDKKALSPFGAFFVQYVYVIFKLCEHLLFFFIFLFPFFFFFVFSFLDSVKWENTSNPLNIMKRYITFFVIQRSAFRVHRLSYTFISIFISFLYHEWINYFACKILFISLLSIVYLSNEINN